MRILLVDDHQIMRDGLRALIEKEPDMEVVAEADNGRDAVRLAKKLNPNVVVMDIGMPKLNGIEASRQIVSESPGVRVLVLSIHSDKRYVTEMLKAGAAGYLVKDCAFEELVTGIRTVAKGRSFLSPRISDIVVNAFVSSSTPLVATTHSESLTSREREVIQLFAEGSSTKEVAYALHISVKTVESHRRHIMRKLHARGIADLTRYAIREGLTSLDHTSRDNEAD